MTEPAVQTPATTDVRAPLAVPETLAANEGDRPVISKPPESMQTAIMPPEKTAPTLPNPPIAAAGIAAGDATAANEVHGNKDIVIEQLLARFIGRHLPAGAAKGLMLEFVSVPSSVVTADGEGQHDIAMTFKGGDLDNPEKSKKLATMLRAAMQEHPAFAGMSFAGADQPVEHFMRCQILGLEKERYEDLLKPPPVKHFTFIPQGDSAITPATRLTDAAPAAGHACAGAGCSSCAAPAVATDQQAAKKTDIVSQPAAADPVTQIVNPAHLGVAANQDKLAIGA